MTSFCRSSCVQSVQIMNGFTSEIMSGVTGEVGATEEEMQYCHSKAVDMMCR